MARFPPETSGYLKLANGMILQWGAIASLFRRRYHNASAYLSKCQLWRLYAKQQRLAGRKSYRSLRLQILHGRPTAVHKPCLISPSADKGFPL